MAISFGGPSIQIGRDPSILAARAMQGFNQLRQVNEAQKQNRVKNAFAAIEAGGGSRSGFFNQLQNNDPLARQLWSDLTGQGGFFGKITGRGFDEKAFQEWRNSPDSVEQMFRAAKDKEWQGFVGEDLRTPDIVQTREVSPAGEREVTVTPGADVIEGRVADLIGGPQTRPGAMGFQQRRQAIQGESQRITQELASKFKLDPNFNPLLNMLDADVRTLEDAVGQIARGTAPDRVRKKGITPQTDGQAVFRLNVQREEENIRKETLEKINQIREARDEAIGKFEESIPFEDDQTFDLQSMVQGIQADPNLTPGAKSIATDIARLRQQVFLRRQQLKSVGGDPRIAGELDKQIKNTENIIDQMTARLKNQITQDMTRTETQQIPAVTETERQRGRALTADEKFDIFFQRMSPAAKAIVAPTGFTGEQEQAKLELDAFQKETNRILAMASVGRASKQEGLEATRSMRTRILDGLNNATQRKDFTDNENYLVEQYAKTNQGFFNNPFKAPAVEIDQEWDEKVAKNPDLKARLERYATEYEKIGGQVLRTEAGTIKPFSNEKPGEAGASDTGGLTPEDMALLQSLGL